MIEGVVPNAAVTVPEATALLGGSAIMGLGAEQTFGFATKTDGSILFYAGMKAPDERAKQELEAAQNKAQRVAWFAAHFPHWSAMWADLFAAAERFAWRPLFTYPLHHRWDVKPNVTLIGDAAHVIPPYAGEGVNMAMLDALVLSRELACQPDTRAAIAAYQDEMFGRMQGIADETVANTEKFYAPDAAEQIVGLFKSFARRAAEHAEPVSDLPN